MITALPHTVDVTSVVAGFTMALACTLIAAAGVLCINLVRRILRIASS